MGTCTSTHINSVRHTHWCGGHAWVHTYTMQGHAWICMHTIVGSSRSRIIVCFENLFYQTSSSRRKWIQSKGPESIRRWGNFPLYSQSLQIFPRMPFLFKAHLSNKYKWVLGYFPSPRDLDAQNTITSLLLVRRKKTSKIVLNRRKWLNIALKLCSPS